MMKKIILGLLSLGFIVLSCVANDTTTSAPAVRNVIFMIGDGMGVNQMYIAYTANNGNLAMVDRTQYVGLVRTNATNRYNPDSAAAGTAIACGEKTNNGMLGVRPDGSPMKSMLEYAAEYGLSTGMVVTCEKTHATPAAFVAKVASRGDHEDIALAFVDAPLNVSIGGGRKYFEERTDGQNLTAHLKSKGFRIAYTMDEVKENQSDDLFALLAEIALPTYPSRGEMLPEATDVALNILSRNPKGFFLMVEGSQIDWEAHNNNREGVINEMLDFDRAVAVALNFAQNCGNTLVIITGDHETGALSITNGNMREGTATTHFASTDHTGVPVPVYSYGPGAEMFTGVFDDTEYLPRILKLWGFER
jgi:alkaline phosphatase